MKSEWKKWAALAAALFGISLFTAVTAGEFQEDLDKLKKDQSEQSDQEKKS